MITNIFEPSFHVTAQVKGDVTTRHTFYVEGWVYRTESMNSLLHQWYCEATDRDPEKTIVEVCSIDFPTT